MKIRATENIMIDGQHVEAGSIIDVSKEDAALLKGIKRAVDPDDESYNPPEKDEYLQLVEDMNEKDFYATAKSLDVDVKGLNRAEANLVLADAMKEADK